MRYHAASRTDAAALLRFAYLADVAVRCVGLLPVRTGLGAAGVRLQDSVSDGPVLELRLAGDVDGHVLILQRRDPDTWFDAEQWTGLAAQRRAPPGPAPLSTPRRFPAVCAPVLRMLGARCLRGSRWTPPPGSATDDLEVLVHQRTEAAPKTSRVARSR